jgi:AraC-like DNA-binding protein
MASGDVTVERSSDIETSTSSGSWWEMAERATHPGLSGLVRRVQTYDERSPELVCRREIPHGGVTLIVGLGDPIDVAETTRPRTHRVTSFVAGLHESSSLVESKAQRGVQIDLTPLGAFRLLGLPQSEIANQIIPLDVLRGRDVAELSERLAGTPDWAGQFDLIDRLLLRWSDDGPAPDPAVSWAWEQLERSTGRTPVGVLADEIGWSRRHFAARFREQVGLAPKPTARVLRFHWAADLLLRAKVGTTITDVAMASGYADHSHMTREFQALAGLTPSAYVASHLGEGPGMVTLPSSDD